MSDWNKSKILFYATPTWGIFITYKAGGFGTIRICNCDQSKIVVIDDIYIETNTSCSMTLKYVRHVLNLRLNLNFGMTLDKQEHVNTFGGEMWKVTLGSQVIARGSTCGPLYKTQVKMYSNDLETIEDEVSASFWHKRLGHVGEKGLQILEKHP